MVLGALNWYWLVLGRSGLLPAQPLAVKILIGCPAMIRMTLYLHLTSVKVAQGDNVLPMIQVKGRHSAILRRVVVFPGINQVLVLGGHNITNPRYAMGKSGHHSTNPV